MPGPGPVLAIDIGTAKIAALLARQGDSGPQFLGVGRVASSGVRRGQVLDIEAAAEAIASAVRRAGRGAERAPAWVVAGGPHFSAINNRASVTITRASREITSGDVREALRAASEVSLPDGFEIVHIIPSGFAVDGMAGVSQPAGLSGANLEAAVHIITAPSNALDNIEKCVEAAGLKLEDFVYAPIACAEATLSAAERQAGAVAIDIGAATTDFMLFVDGGPVSSGCLPVGGRQIAQDLSIGLRVPLDVAESVATASAVATAALTKGEGPVLVRDSAGGQRKVPRMAVAEIVEERLLEIFSLVKTQIAKTRAVLAGGAVLSGGASQIPGTALVAEHVLGCPVRVFGAAEVGVLPQLGDASLAAVMGGARFALLQAARREEASRRPGFWKSLRGRMRHFKRAVWR